MFPINLSFFANQPHFHYEEFFRRFSILINGKFALYNLSNLLVFRMYCMYLKVKIVLLGIIFQPKKRLAAGLRTDPFISIVVTQTP